MDNNGTPSLDQNLFPINTPYTQGNQINGYLFNSQNENGAINAEKIANLSFNQASGGTINLGGAGNGNGELLIKDSSGNIIVEGNNGGITVNNTSGGSIVTLNSNGITINSGSITIQNSDGTNIIDANGLISTNNFSFGTKLLTPNDIGGTVSGYVDIPTGSITFNLARTTNILFMASVTAAVIYSGTGNVSSNIVMNVNGTQIDPFPLVNNGTFFQSVSMQNIFQVGAGTNIIFKLQYESISGGTLRQQESVMSYVALGN